jgi:hypothetical protein
LQPERACGLISCCRLFTLPNREFSVDSIIDQSFDDFGVGTVGTAVYDVFDTAAGVVLTHDALRIYQLAFVGDS